MVTIPTTDPTLRSELEQGIEEYADVTQAKSYTDLETVKLVLEIVGEGAGIAANVAAVLLFLRTLNAERAAQGHEDQITVGPPDGPQVPIDQADDALLAQLLRDVPGARQ
jgi:hypothetical protein